jgi:hypothetical protein
MTYISLQKFLLAARHIRIQASDGVIWELLEDRLQDAFEIGPGLHIVRQSDDPNVLELTAWDCAFLWHVGTRADDAALIRAEEVVRQLQQHAASLGLSLEIDLARSDEGWEIVVRRTGLGSDPLR